MPTETYELPYGGAKAMLLADDVFSDSNNELLVYEYGLQYNKYEVINIWIQKILFLN